ncbi:MAG TPA: alpha/beta hydrolase [Nitrolancea sp.]|nr:alpha/beta hydrolase [Nitrolancea sp.]
MSTMTMGRDRWLLIRGLRLHIRIWDGDGVPFVLVHGLSSNCMTWEAVAQRLHAAGHAVITLDQRGHGLSDKPDSGYGFADVTADLQGVIEAQDWNEQPVVAGQSWGGSVVLQFAARYPAAARGSVLVDGGFMSMRSRDAEMSWEQLWERLKPPTLIGMRRDDLALRMRRGHPDWSDEGIEHTLANFETLPDGTIRPWLALDHHREILHAMWEQDPDQLYGQITTPLLAVAAGPEDAERAAQKRAGLAAFEQQLPRSRSYWFERTDHDIHVQRPDELAALLLESLSDGFFPASAANDSS